MINALFNGALSILSEGQVTIFAFHKVPLERDPLRPTELHLSQWIRLLDVIQTSFRIVPLQHAIENMRAGTSLRRVACLTFDDGYADWMDGVVPLLRDRNLHATFFIATQQLIGRPIWNERICQVVRGMSSSQLGHHLPEDAVAGMSDNEARVRVLAHIEHGLKYMSLEKRFEQLARLEHDVGITSDALRKFTFDDLDELHRCGFGIGAHTMNHPILSLCPDAQAYEEIHGSMEVLRQHLGVSVPFFAYPNGHAGDDYLAKHVEMVREIGFDAAVCTDWGVLSNRTSSFEVPRFTPWGKTTASIKYQLVRNILIK